MTQRACEKTGVAFELRRVARVDIEAAVIAANKEARVHGIIIYYPIFGGPIDDYLRDVIGLEKDVEGLNHRYRYSLYHNIRTIDNDAGKKCVLPCTPLACVQQRCSERRTGQRILLSQTPLLSSSACGEGGRRKRRWRRRSVNESTHRAAGSRREQPSPGKPSLLATRSCRCLLTFMTSTESMA